MITIVQCNLRVDLHASCRRTHSILATERRGRPVYKSAIVEALRQLAPSNGGAVDGLLQLLGVARETLDSAAAEIAKANQESLKRGVNALNEAIAPLSRRLAEISPSMTAIELYGLSSRFDEIQGQYPELKPLILPGRRALGALSGAFDIALQHNRKLPSLIGLVTPGLALAAELEHYRALVDLHRPTDAEGAEGSAVVIEIEGAETLPKLLDFVALLTGLAKLAGRVVEEIEHRTLPASGPIVIASIDSGSPIQIRLIGGRSLRLLVSMLRDLIRTPYLHFTNRGRLLDALETFEYAKRLQAPPEVLDRIVKTMQNAAERYHESIATTTTITVDGERNSAEVVETLPKVPRNMLADETDETERRRYLPSRDESPDN